MTTNPNLFQGQYATGVLGAAFLGGNDINLGLWRVEQGIKDKLIVKLLNRASALQTGSYCSLTPSAGGTFSDKAVELVSYAVKEAVCKEDLVGTSYDMNQRAGFWNTTIVQEALDAYIMEIAKGEAYNLARIRWSGNTASADPVLALANGIIAKILAYGVYNATTNPDGYRSVTAAGSITSSNVIDEINKVLNATPAAVRNQMGFKIVVSPEIAAAYQQAVAANVALATWNMGMPADLAGNPGFLGYFSGTRVPLYIADGLVGTNPRTMLAGVFTNSKQGNLILGTDALADFQTIVVQDRSQYNVTEHVIDVAWAARMGVEVGRADELVLYHP